MQFKNIEKLQTWSARDIADVIRNEHPQIIAVLMCMFDKELAAQVITYFTERLRNDVALRSMTIDIVNNKWIKVIDSGIGQAMRRFGSKSYTNLENKDLYIVGIPYTQYMGVMNNIREYDPELAQRFIDKAYPFERLLDVDDIGIQAILREIQSDCLILALKGSSEELQEKIFKNMSKLHAEALREDLNNLSRYKMEESEREQKEILKIAHRLAAEGVIDMWRDE